MLAAPSESTRAAALWEMPGPAAVPRRLVGRGALPADRAVPRAASLEARAEPPGRPARRTLGRLEARERAARRRLLRDRAALAAGRSQRSGRDGRLASRAG